MESSQPPKDSSTRLAEAVEALAADVRQLVRKVGVQDADVRLTNQSVRALRAAHAELESRVGDQFDALSERTSTLESNVGSISNEQANALVICVEDARKLSKKALERIEVMEREQKDNAEETKAQTPMLAKVDDQTKAMAVPAKAAAIFNTLWGLVWLAIEIWKALQK